MWFSEVHRIGFQKCTPLGHALLIIGDYMFLAAVLVPLGHFLVAAVDWIEFRWTVLLWSIVLVSLGIILKMTASMLAALRNFRYHYEPDRCEWCVDDKKEEFTHEEWERDYLPKLRERR